MTSKMDSASSKMSDMQMSQYRSMKNIENLDFHISELTAETETETKELREKQERLKKLQTENVDMKANLQKLRKWHFDYLYSSHWQTASLYQLKKPMQFGCGDVSSKFVKKTSKLYLARIGYNGEVAVCPALLAYPLRRWDRNTWDQLKS